MYVAEERWPLDHRHGHLPLSPALAVGETAAARLAPGLDPSDLERAAFLDVETTGLAGGTGTLAFLVGVARFEDGGLCLPGGAPCLLPAGHGGDGASLRRPPPAHLGAKS